MSQEFADIKLGKLPFMLIRNVRDGAINHLGFFSTRTGAEEYARRNADLWHHDSACDYTILRVDRTIEYAPAVRLEPNITIPSMPEA